MATPFSRAAVDILRNVLTEDKAAEAYERTMFAAGVQAANAMRERDASVCDRLAAQMPEHAEALHQASAAIRRSNPGGTTNTEENR
jgi:hypothetical protein